MSWKHCPAKVWNKSQLPGWPKSPAHQSHYEAGNRRDWRAPKILNGWRTELWQPLHLRTNQEEVSASPSDPHQQQKFLRNLNHKIKTKIQEIRNPWSLDLVWVSQGVCQKIVWALEELKGQDWVKCLRSAEDPPRKEKRAGEWAPPLFAKVDKAVKLTEKIAALELANERWKMP